MSVGSCSSCTACGSCARRWVPIMLGKPIRSRNADMQPTCIRVGYGAIAQIHEVKLDMLGVRTLAIVETHPERRMAAERAGFQVATSCTEVAELRPTFWDICVPTQYHVDILEMIAACDPCANILIEKPICRYTD